MPKFRTKWNCVINDGETFVPNTSLFEPGQSESIEHIVQRLTRKAKPTMRDLYVVAQATGQSFEDPTTLSDIDLDDRMERVVAQGDNIDAAEAMLDAQADLEYAQTAAASEVAAKAQREQQQSAASEDEQKQEA